MARTKNTARKTSSSASTQGGRAIFQFSSGESDRDLPTSPLGGRGKGKGGKHRGNKSPKGNSGGTKSPKRAAPQQDPKPDKKRRRGPDVSPRAPIPGDPNRGSHPTKDPHQVRPKKPPKKTALPGGGDPAARAGGGGGGGPNDPARTFTGVAARNNARRQPRQGRHYRPPKGIRDAQGKLKRRRPGAIALREIRYYQKDDKPIIPARPFVRLIQELTQDEYPNRGIRWQAEAIRCMQQASERLLAEFFELANDAAIHARRITIMPKDMILVKKMTDAHFPRCITTRRKAN